MYICDLNFEGFLGRYNFLINTFCSKIFIWLTLIISLNACEKFKKIDAIKVLRLRLEILFF